MISIKLSDAMGKKKVKMSHVIKATGISRPTLTELYYERSKGINFETLEKLCRYFKVDVGELIKFEKDGVQHGIQ
jgi:putative transcriptional regulator